MKKTLLVLAAITAFASFAFAQGSPTPPPMTLKVGQAAPDFTLPSTIAGADGRSVRYKLSDFKGKKNVVLAFYVLAFTGG